MAAIKNIMEKLLGAKVGDTRVFPITYKILFVFILFILLSNFSSHYLSLMLYRGEMVRLVKQQLVRDLKDIYSYANSQYEIYRLQQNLKSSVDSIEAKAVMDFKNRKSVLLGVRPDGSIMVQSSSLARSRRFPDSASLAMMRSNLARGVREEFATFTFNNETYFGIYKYNTRWGIFLVRAEEYSEFHRESARIFKQISIIIIVITLICALAGVYIMQYILRYIWIITNQIVHMTREQKLDIISLGKAHGDDITFLGMAFNALANTVNNLLRIFQKFTNKDIVLQAYQEREVRLEGSSRELTCLFSDIKSFTTMTEVLGTEIITLLNIHYTSVINAVLAQDGIIGSIIGDALLAVYGVFSGSSARRKSFQAVTTGYKIHEIAGDIRKRMDVIRGRTIAEKGILTPAEEKVCRAVMIDVGVGIDGGMVFYGNIGSYERMTNTVIGDNVNSASRLEGLNRIYGAPVICSEYVKEDIEQNVKDHGIRFMEIDTVRVKGKTTGKKIFWPIFRRDISRQLIPDLAAFSEGLRLYYRGAWKQALREFSRCRLPAAKVFQGRIEGAACPRDWEGIWTMDSK